MSNTNGLPEITLDELGRLIRILGMLGSAADGEVVNAARLAVKWVREKGTDWETLLTPEPEPGVTGVATIQSQEDQRQEQAAAYDKGYRAGIQAMAAQVKAQAAAIQGLHNQAAAQAAQQTPHAASQGLAGGFGSPYPPNTSPTPDWAVPGAANPHAAPSWKYVAWELLHLDAGGMPGVFRGSREQDFVASLLVRGWASLTTAQDNWLRDIAGRSSMTW